MAINRHPLLPYNRILAIVVVVLCSLSLSAFAEPVPAIYKQGSLHGFLLLKSQEGKVIAIGDQINVVHGNQVRSELVFHFRDGSIDDEVAEFRQGAVFELVRDHHIQKGPSFPQPLDMNVDVPAGTVTWQEKKGDKMETRTQHMDLPHDLVNGMMMMLAENFPSKRGELQTSYLAADPKPRVVKFSVRPAGEDRVDIGGDGRQTNQFDVHIEIGGIAGAIAPLVGKQPSDIKLWVVGKEAPVLVRMDGALYPQGPIWTILLTSPTWPSGLRDSGM